jgi:hypothetical protein
MGVNSVFNKNLHTEGTNPDSCPAVDYGEENDLFVTKHVESPYTLMQEDSNKFLIFNTGGIGTVNIPDNLYVGTAALFANIGTGSVEFAMLNLETIRGATVIGDPDGYMTVAKLTDDIWQSSERG